METLDRFGKTMKWEREGKGWFCKITDVWSAWVGPTKSGWQSIKIYDTNGHTAQPDRREYPEAHKTRKSAFGRF